METKSVRQACKPRPEVLQGDLDDAIFAADFGHVITGCAPDVYQDPERFFRNTHPAEALKKLTTTVFERLANPGEAGATLRLSTGYGGGKTHALIALWHLARNIDNPAMGTELVPVAGRPPRVAVAAVDGDKAGTEVFVCHENINTRSLWGELAYQLGGPDGYSKIKDHDRPETVPPAGLIRQLMPADRPVLILIDELVLYMTKISERGNKALLGFINSLISETVGRKGAILVITDPGEQTATQQEARELAEVFEKSEQVKALQDVLARKASDFDPIGGESAQVITRRLFETIQSEAAQAVSAAYFQAYQRIAQQMPGALPSEALNRDYADRIVQCYPFHPRLLDTARDRLGAIQDFQKSRGVLRLFARILRDVWESESDLSLISAGDINWSSDRIQADLLHRLNKDRFAAAVDADIRKHAAELDAEHSTHVHRRAASALLLESLAPNGSMTRQDLTLAIVRPDEVGHEPSEALDRLMSVCWHTYRVEAGDRYKFDYEPNPNKLIEETVPQIPIEDARQAVLAIAQGYFGGSIFELVPYPSSPRAVSDTPRLKLVLAEREEDAQAVCDYQDSSNPDAPVPRRFRNAIFGVAATPDGMQRAIADQRRVMAAERVLKEHGNKKEVRKQIEQIKPGLQKRAQTAACRAFSRVLFQGRPSVTLDEKYLVSEESPLQQHQGQANLKRFLDDNKLVFGPTDVLDVDLLVGNLLPGATPSTEHEGAYPASSVHERALASDKLRLMMDQSPVRNAIIRAVQLGKLVVRLPDGRVYDSQGCVSGPESSRKRTSDQLTTLSLTSDVLLAPPDAACVGAWTNTAEEARPEEKKEAGQTPDTPPDSVSATDPETALQYAAGRPLKRLTLRATSPEGARELPALVQQFGAKNSSLSVRVMGSLKDGGRVSFAVEEAKLTCSIKPIQRAEEILRAAQDGAELDCTAKLDFGENGEMGKQAPLEQLKDIPEVNFVAEFGRES